MSALVFGEVLWDVYPDAKYIGGASLNFAAHLARHGHKISLLSALGQDDLGAEAMEQLQQWGISGAYISLPTGKQTGSCQVTLDENSVPSYDLLRDVAYDYIDCDRVQGSFELLYFGTLALREQYNTDALQRMLGRCSFGQICVDVNIRPPFSTPEAVRLAVQTATILKISQEEMAVVAGFLGLQEKEDYRVFSQELAEKYANLRCVLITLGADGTYALDTASGNGHVCPGKKVEVVSTVGAGDSFFAAFVHRYLERNDLPGCLSYATQVAGFVVANTAAVPEYDPADFEKV